MAQILGIHTRKDPFLKIIQLLYYVISSYALLFDSKIIPISSKTSCYIDLIMIFISAVENRVLVGNSYKYYEESKHLLCYLNLFATNHKD